MVRQGMASAMPIKAGPHCCFPAFAAGKMPAAKAGKGKLGPLHVGAAEAAP